ncbi:MAG TPA: radical SAM protein [Candidatus Limnocylindrales bacterium]|nr:radical SAM protein [Candidatus Limnocylindrales bacterium]
MPKLVFSDSKGQIYDHPILEMAGRSGDLFVRPSPEELIPLPAGSRFFTLPERQPVGWSRSGKSLRILDTVRMGQKMVTPYAVAAFLSPGYVRTLLPAATSERVKSFLPLWAYTAIGWQDEQFYVAATRVDDNPTWNPENYDDRILVEKVQDRLQTNPHNRLLHQVAHCALKYHCFTAKNVFYQRWEAGIPTSPACNADCVGCISLQPSRRVQASHERLDFVPTVEEIVDLGLSHLKKAENGIISFGQGCEGEPLMQAELIAKAILRIRRETCRGTIHMNTNGSKPAQLRYLCEAGLESIRVSLNSANPPVYESYYQPKNYSFKEVVESIKIARDYGLFVSINLLTFPGVTDREEEVESLFRLIRETRLNMVQIRNLNIDPDLYLQMIPGRKGKIIGILNFLKNLKQEFPELTIGCFTRPREGIQERIV